MLFARVIKLFNFSKISHYVNGEILNVWHFTMLKLVIRFLWFWSQMKLQLSCFHTVWVPMLYLVIFIAKLKLLQKPVFQQHRGRHLDGVFIHMFCQGLKLIWVKTAWLYLYWFKSYDRLKNFCFKKTPCTYIVLNDLANSIINIICENNKII